MKTNSSTYHWMGRVKMGNAYIETLKSLSILVACTLIGLVFYIGGLSEANIISIYILGILLISSITPSWVFSFFSSIAGVLLFNSMFAEPRFTLLVFDPQYIITMIIMLAATLLTSSIMTSYRRQLRNEMMAAKRSEVLLETSQTLLQAQNSDEILGVATSKLVKLFSQDAMLIPANETELLEEKIILSSPDNDIYATMNALQKSDMATWAFSDSDYNHTITVLGGRKKLIFFKIKSQSELLAVVSIQLDRWDVVSDYEQNLVKAMLDEVTLAIENDELRTFNENIAREAEAERLRANLLRTISHDLRTPLTSISGHADILLQNGTILDSAQLHSIYEDIYNDSSWLIGLVENLLFVTRFENGTMAIQLQAELLQDIITEAVNHSKRRYKSHKLVTNITDELLVINADARLIMQVVANIIDNAVKYSPKESTIELRAHREENFAVVEISDMGSGISDEDKTHIFDMFYTANKPISDSRRGMGLGLFLCQAIIAAHGSNIYLRDNANGGSVFGFKLKLEEVKIEDNHTGN